MSTPAGYHPDGDNTVAYQIGSTVKSQDPITFSLLYRQTWRVRHDRWAPIKLNTRGPGGRSFLVEETEPKDIDFGMVEWERLYAEVPRVRAEAQDFVYSNQLIVIGEQLEIAEIAVPCGAILVHHYFHTQNPTTIPLLRTYRLTKVGNTIYQQGTKPGENDQWIIAADSSFARWRGYIWERVTPYVKRQDLAEVVP